jgi:tetratricopeptide (TPR) repeat protein
LFLSIFPLAELELGLFDDAVDKFTRALENADEQMHSMAAYGQGLARLSMARRDLLDGKAGAAFVHVEKAIKGCDDFELKAGCIQKLLGDLYSFGASLPPNVFDADGFAVEGRDDQLIKAQLAFISSGEAAYRSAEDAVVAPTENEVDTVRACLVTDLGSNLLYQAQLLSFWCNRIPGQTSAEAENMFQRSVKEFRRAIDLSPHYAPAWCGLGCARSGSDPLLAQHAFCRSLELDSLYPDTYANLGFLYTKHNAYAPSGSVSDALTQVADTPMMWINRALVLERQAADNVDEDERQSEDTIRQAADAYRAALQVGKHPSAMLGLAMTCRASRGGKVSMRARLEQLATKESLTYITEYLGAVGNAETNVSVISDVLALEKRVYNYTSGQEGSVEEESRQLSTRLDQLVSEGQNSHSGLDLDVIRRVVATDTHSGNHDSAPIHKRGSASLTSAIIHDPSRGDLWLDLSKDLTRKIKSSDYAQTLVSARTAAQRATTILMHNVVEPSSGAGSNNSVDAEDVSDALALKYWLDCMYSESNENSSPRSNVDVQRALLMYPGNAVARSALSLPAV